MKGKPNDGEKLRAHSLDDVVDALAAIFAERVTPKLLAKLDERALAMRPDPLLTVQQAAKHSGLHKDAIRLLIAQGLIKKAPGLIETRIRQSVMDAYATNKAS